MSFSILHLELEAQHPHVFGYTDGTNKRLGTARTFPVQEGKLALSNCTVWPLNADLHLATLARIFPTADMTTAAWPAASGNWVAERQNDGLDWLLQTNTSGGKVNSASALGASGAMSFSIVQNKPVGAVNGSLTIELANAWKIIIPTFTAGGIVELYRWDNGAFSTVPVKAGSPAVLNQRRAGVANIDLQVTCLNGTLVFDLNGERFVSLARDSNPTTPPTGTASVTFTNSAGRFFGGECTWQTSGTVRPQVGVALETWENPTLTFDVAFDKPSGGTDPTAADTTYVNGVDGLTYHQPLVTLTGNGTQTPYVFGVTLKSINEIATANTTKRELVALAKRVEGWYELRERGSIGVITLHGVRPEDVPLANSLITIRGAWDGGAVKDDARLFVLHIIRRDEDEYAEYPKRQFRRRRRLIDYRRLQRVTLVVGDWATDQEIEVEGGTGIERIRVRGRLATKRAVKLPDAYGYEFADFLIYVLRDRLGVPAAYLSVQDDNYTIRADAIKRYAIDPHLDGVSATDQLVSQRAWEWLVSQPTGIVVVRAPTTAVAKSVAGRDGVYVNPTEDITRLAAGVTAQVIETVDAVGNRVLTMKLAAERVSDEKADGFTGDLQQDYVRIDLNDTPSTIATNVMNAHNRGADGPTITWTSPNLWGDGVPDVVITPPVEPGLVASDSFEIVTKRVEFYFEPEEGSVCSNRATMSVTARPV